MLGMYYFIIHFRFCSVSHWMLLINENACEANVSLPTHEYIEVFGKQTTDPLYTKVETCCNLVTKAWQAVTLQGLRGKWNTAPVLGKRKKHTDNMRYQ